MLAELLLLPAGARGPVHGGPCGDGLQDGEGHALRGSGEQCPQLVRREEDQAGQEACPGHLDAAMAVPAGSRISILSILLTAM